ncbi:MAG TPA: HAD-IG family 5'-nucleotidase [Polyangiaceae bacterium]|nr:HAD-IG family 5'-nucleotidase [Polyangiaceae bacterium]
MGDIPVTAIPSPVSDPRQLILPIAGVSLPPPNGHAICRKDRVFVNRDLRLAGIQWFGFDMDYTLAIYRQDEMDRLSVELTVERLIRRGYPSYLKHLEYDTRFPIRGLLVDKRHGHVLKMDRYKVVHYGYHGMRRLPREELAELYHHKRIRPHTPRYHWIDTLFALSEVTSYAAIVDALEKRGEKVDFDRLFSDVRSAIDEAHADGAVYAAITADFPRYIERDPELARTLHKLRSAGKHLFLLTNSPFHYTHSMMNYLLGEAMPEYPTWRHFFDIVICAAAKPRWFQEGRPLLERDGENLRHVRGQLERGRVYEGGNLADFERLASVQGSSVLYVGDHIYGDILRSKKESSWHTAMIIPELDAEVEAYEVCAEDLARQRVLEETRDRLEDELRYYQTRYKELMRNPAEFGESERARVKRALDRIRTELRSSLSEHETLAERISTRFHPYFGSLLKEQNEMSSFGLQVDLYADIYMRRVSCLKAYSPQQFFRSPYDLMPHEL